MPEDSSPYRPQSFNPLSKALHWLMALLILGLLCIGFFMTGMEDSPAKGSVFMLHKSFGILVLMLVGLRILWKTASKQPEHIPTHAAWERGLSTLVHILLYVGMIGMPLSGWVMSSAADYPVPFFGLFNLPSFVPKSEALYEAASTGHEVTGFALVAAIGLHYLGAAKHHLLDRDETLPRMTNRSFLMGLMTLAVMGLFLLGATTLAGGKLLSGESHDHEEHSHGETTELSAQNIETDLPLWSIDQQDSTLSFTAVQYGQPFTGEFKNFSGTIAFDPENLEESIADITIDITSVTTGSADRDRQTQGQDWFHTSEFPTARFTSRDFKAIGANRYHVEGDLTLRGVTKPIDFPFTLTFSENDQGEKTAQMSADFILQRLNFGVGQGQWEDAEAVKNQVKVTLDIQAVQSPETE